MSRDPLIHCQRLVKDLTNRNTGLQDQIKQQTARAEKSAAALRELEKGKKPWDIWSVLASWAVSMILWMLHPGHVGVVACCILIFIFLLHPALKFPWIEKKRWRQASSVFLVCCSSILIGFQAWVDPAEGLPPLVVTAYDRTPDNIRLNAVLGVNVHTRNTSSKDIYVTGNFHSYWANDPSPDTNIREQKEDELWRSFTSGASQHGRLIRIPALEKDHWVYVGGDLPPLTDESLYEIHHTKVVYWLAQFRDKKGRVITDICIYSGYDDGSVRFCINHNGQPQS